MQITAQTCTSSSATAASRVGKLAEIAKSYGVDISMISRLKAAI
jgi:hypothetical protein